MSSRNIIVTIGKSQKLLQDREIYPVELCDSIEDLISCNKSNLSKTGGNGYVQFNDENGNKVVKLTIEQIKSFLSDEEKSIICIRCKGGSISANAYYGEKCYLDFLPKEEYSLANVENYVQVLKDFIKSWVFKKGELGALVVIVDRLDVFEKVKFDEAFKGVYLLCSE